MDIPELPDQIAYIRSWLGTGAINLFGLPFSGKDTHGKELADLFGGVLIGGGDIIRNTKELAHINAHINTGALAPTEDYMRIILPYFERPEFKDKPLVLSSVGRWHGEEAGVLEATAESGHPLLAVVYLKITKDELLKRWGLTRQTGGRGDRGDDDSQVIDKRIDEFETKTLPVIDFYRDQGMVIEIDAMAPQAEVSQKILDELYKRAARERI